MLPSELSSRQDFSLYFFLLLLVIFCYPVFRCIMLLCHRHLMLNSFIASINFAWFTSGAPTFLIALMPYLTCSLWLSMNSVRLVVRCVDTPHSQVKGYCCVWRTFCRSCHSLFKLCSVLVSHGSSYRTSVLQALIFQTSLNRRRNALMNKSIKTRLKE